MQNQSEIPKSKHNFNCAKLVYKNKQCTSNNRPKMLPQPQKKDVHAAPKQRVSNSRGGCEQNNFKANKNRPKTKHQNHLHSRYLLNSCAKYAFL